MARPGQSCVQRPKRKTPNLLLENWSRLLTKPFATYERSGLVLMRVVLDTNILISALIVPGGAPDALYQTWRAGQFTLVTSEEQLDEFRRVTRYPRLRPFLPACE